MEGNGSWKERKEAGSYRRERKKRGRKVSDEMDARSAKTARDAKLAKLAMKGLSETGTYRFPQLKLSSTLFSDKRKKCGVKIAGAGEEAEIESFRDSELHYSKS